MALTVPESDMHSHDRTLISRLGFADPDKGDRRHDLACQFLATPGAAESIGRQFVLPKAREVFTPSKWVHSSYSNSNEPDTHVTRTLSGEFWFRVDHEVPLAKGEGKYATTIGFLDLRIGYEFSYVYREERRGKIVCEESMNEALWALFEVKVKPAPVGDILRQIRFYRPHAYHGSYEALWFVVTAFPFSEADTAVFTGTGIHHIQLGSKFEEWASIQEASAPAKPAMEL